MRSLIEQKNAMVLVDKIKSYARSQESIDFLSIVLLTFGTVFIASAVALFLLKSPLYGLIGLTPLAFYRRKNFDQRARELDKKLGANCELVSCIQIARIPENNREGYSKEIASAFVQSTEEKFQHIKPGDFINKKFLNRSINLLFISLIFFLLFPAFFPGRFWFALNHKIEYSIKPGFGKFDRGETIDLNINLSGPYLPQRVKLFYQTNSATQSTILPVREGQAEKSIVISEPLKFHFEFFGIKTRIYDLKVIEPIYLKELTFHLHYPRYTNLKEEIKTERQLIVPAGTEIDVNGIASSNLKQARLIFNDTVNFECNDTAFSGKFKINSSGNAILQISGESSHNEPITIYAIPDLAPLVEIFYPGYNINLPPDMKLTIGIKCSDDYGLNQVVFNCQFKESEALYMKFKRGSAEDTIFYDWDLNPLRMLPGDRVSYFVEVQDNAGQKTKSKTYYVFFPTMEQLYEEVKGKEELMQTDLKNLEKSHQEGMSEINRLEEKLKREKEFSWLDNEKLKEAINREEKVLEKIEEWQTELQNTIEKLKSGIILDQKSIERLQEITKILQEIAPEELRQALENLKQAMNRNPEEIKQVMEKLKDAQEELARALERTLELLKQYQQEEKLKELAEQTKELADNANRLNDLQQFKNSDALKESLDSLYRAIDSLAQEINKLAESEGIEQNISEQLKKSSRQAKSMSQEQNMSPEDLEKGLNQLASDLQRLYEELTRTRAANLRRNLLETLNQLIELSKLEEDQLTKDKIDPDIQSEIINATKVLAESLYAQQVKSLYVTPDIGKRLSKAIKEMKLASLNPASTGRWHSQEAMKQLNLASLSILQSLKKAAEGTGSSTGMDEFFKGLSQITQNQMGLGQSVMSLFPLSVSGLTSEQMAQMHRLAGKQRELRQALESLKGSPEAGKFQELLDNLAEEMKENEEALYQYKIDRKLIERQQLIISRLLDADRSIRQEDWTKQRKSRPGEDKMHGSPLSLPEELGRDQLLEIIQHALKQPHPEQYELYIREYFRALLEERQ